MDHKQHAPSRTRSAIRNVIFNLGYQFINTIVNIILPPMIIGKFGSVTNGLISTIKQIINYVQLVGAGISDSTIITLYKPLAENDRNKISAIYAAVGKAFSHAGTLFSVLSILVAFIYPLFLKEELDYYFVVKMVLILSISGVSEFFAIGKYRALLTADQKVFVVNIAQIIGAVTSTAATILLIKIDCSILFVQLTAALAYVLRICVLYLYMRKHYGYLDLKAKPDNSAISRRKSATVHQLTALVMLGSQSLIVASFCGLEEASVYSVYNLIYTGINTVLSTVSSAMLASMGNLMASDDNQRVKKVYSIYELGFYIVAISFYITTLIMITPFIRLYTQGITDANYIRPNLVVLLVILGFLSSVRTPGVTIILAKGHYNETQGRALIEMTICVIGQLCFVSKMGIEGVILGTIIAYAYRTVDIVIYSNQQIMGQSPFVTFRRILLGAAILAVASILLNWEIQVNGYLSWILSAVVVLACAITTTMIVNTVLDRKTLRNGMGYVKEILKR